MASITIRNLDKELKTRLRVQAAVHGRSMEEEARNILSSAFYPKKQKKPLTLLKVFKTDLQNLAV